MDGCEVEDQLELGFNLFTANSDLQVMCFLCHDFRIEFYRFWSFAALPSPSIQISPFPTSPSWLSSPCMGAASPPCPPPSSIPYLHCPKSPALTSATIPLFVTATSYLWLISSGNLLSWNCMAHVLSPPTCMASSWMGFSTVVGLASWSVKMVESMAQLLLASPLGFSLVSFFCFSPGSTGARSHGCPRYSAEKRRNDSLLGPTLLATKKTSKWSRGRLNPENISSPSYLMVSNSRRTRRQRVKMFTRRFPLTAFLWISLMWKFPSCDLMESLSLTFGTSWVLVKCDPIPVQFCFDLKFI